MMEKRPWWSTTEFKEIQKIAESFWQGLTPPSTFLRNSHSLCSAFSPGPNYPTCSPGEDFPGVIASCSAFIQSLFCKVLTLRILGIYDLIISCCFLITSQNST